MPVKIDILVDFRGHTTAEAIYPFAKKIIHMPMNTVGEAYRSSLNPTIDTLTDFYIEIVDNHRFEFIQLLKLISSSSSIGFGCYFGKDRTGVASYLISKKFNVTTENIILDYTRSEYELKKNIDLFSAHWLKRNISKKDYMKRLVCPAQVIYKLDHYLVQRYGGVHRYLDEQLII